MDLGRRQDAALSARGRLAGRRAGTRSSFARRGFAAEQVRLTTTTSSSRRRRSTPRSPTTEFHQDPVVAGNKKVVATVAFTHPVDRESFERRVDCRCSTASPTRSKRSSRRRRYTVVYDKLKLNAYVHTAQLEVPPKAGRLQIDDRAAACTRRAAATRPQRRSTTSVEVPGLNSLKIANRRARHRARRAQRAGPGAADRRPRSRCSRRDMPQKVQRVAAAAASIRIAKLQSEFERASAVSRSPGPTRRCRPKCSTRRHAARAHADSRRARALRAAQLPLQRRSGPTRSTCKIDAGLKSFGGYVLGDSRRAHPARAGISARAEHPARKGSLLSLSGEKTLVAVRTQRAGDARRGRPAAAAPVAAPGHADRAATSRRRSSTTGRSTPRTSPSASMRVAAAAARRAGQGAVRSARPRRVSRSTTRQRPPRHFPAARAGLGSADQIAPLEYARRRLERRRVGTLARCATDRRHRSRPGRQTLGRRRAGRVRAVDRDRRRRSRGVERRNHRPQRPAGAHAKRRTREGHVRFPGSAELPARTPAGAVSRAARRRQLVPADRRARPHARSVALRCRRRGEQCAIAARCRRICSPIAASIVPARRFAPPPSCAARTGRASSPACRCGSRSPIRAAR